MSGKRGRGGAEASGWAEGRRADGAPGRTRTSTMFPPPDFESGASTNSATGAFRRAAQAAGRRAARIIAAERRRSTAAGDRFRRPSEAPMIAGETASTAAGDRDERRSAEFLAAQVPQGGRRHVA